MIHIAKHKLYAIAVYIVVILIVYFRDGHEKFIQSAVILGIFLFLIVFSEFVAWLSSWGMPEALASDHGTPLSPGLVSLFLWLVFLIACMFHLFKWSIY